MTCCSRAARSADPLRPTASRRTSLTSRSSNGVTGAGSRPAARSRSCSIDGLDVPAAEQPVVRRRLQGEQPRGAGVGVGLVERRQVGLAGVGRRQRQVQGQAGPRLAPPGGRERLPLDRVAGVREAVHDRLDQLRRGARTTGSPLVRPRRATNSRTRLSMCALASMQQVGRHVTEDDGVADLRRRGSTRVDTGELLDGLHRLERVVDGGHAELGPHDLSVLVDRDTPPRTQRLDQQDAATGHVVGAAVRADRGSGAGVPDRDSNVAGGAADRHRDRRGAVLAGVRQQLGGDHRRVVDGVVGHRVRAPGRARSGARRARRPARRRARRSRRRRERPSTPCPIPAAAELAAAGRVRSSRRGYLAGASAKTVAQSYFMLTTVQSWPRARSSDSSAPAV